MISSLVLDIVRKQNQELKEKLGEVEGLALYKWVHSDSNEMYVPQLVWEIKTGDEPEPVKVYYCACGVDKLVHEPWCKSLIIAKNKAELKSTAPHLKNQWVFCKWVAPPPEHEWYQSLGDQFPYPRNGFYIPCAAKGNELALRRGEYPRPETTKEIIRHFVNLRDRGAKEEDANTRLHRLASDAKRKQRYYDMFLDAAPVGDDKPGTKHNVSLPSVII
jgi:hypothetical protein